MSRFRHDRCQPGPNTIPCEVCGTWYDQNGYCCSPVEDDEQEDEE